MVLAKPVVMLSLNSLKDNVLRNRILVENFTFLGVLHITNLVIFFVTIPFLFRVLGSNSYGLVIFAQTIVFYLSIFVNFGFNLTATRDISIYRNDHARLTEIVSSVLIIKMIFFIISFLVMILLTFTIPIFRDHRILFIVSMLASLSEALFPVWYFQGIEKMKYITYINAAARLLATAMVFVIIREPSDYAGYPLLLGAGTVAGAVIALAIVFGSHKVNFVFQPFRILKQYFADNLLYFFSNVSTQIYVNANKIIVGSFLGMTEVAFYDVAEKVINIVKVPFSLLGQTIFPKFSREKNLHFLRKIMYVTIAYTSGIIAMLYIFSGHIVSLISGTYNKGTVVILRILSISLIPIMVSLFYGDLMLISFDHKTKYARMRFTGLILYTFSFLFLYFTGNLTVVTISATVVLLEFFIAAFSYILCRKEGLTVKIFEL